MYMPKETGIFVMCQRMVSASSLFIWSWVFVLSKPVVVVMSYFILFRFVKESLSAVVHGSVCFSLSCSAIWSFLMSLQVLASILAYICDARGMKTTIRMVMYAPPPLTRRPIPHSCPAPSISCVQPPLSTRIGPPRYVRSKFASRAFP